MKFGNQNKNGGLLKHNSSCGRGKGGGVKLRTIDDAENFSEILGRIWLHLKLQQMAN